MQIRLVTFGVQYLTAVNDIGYIKVEIRYNTKPKGG